MVKEQSGEKRYLGVLISPNSNNLKIWKRTYLKKNLRVAYIVIDYADTRLSNFAIEYLHINENVHEILFVCWYGAQVESFKPKKWSYISWHCPFKYNIRNMLHRRSPSGVRITIIIRPTYIHKYNAFYKNKIFSCDTIHSIQ